MISTGYHKFTTLYLLFIGQLTKPTENRVALDSLTSIYVRDTCTSALGLIDVLRSKIKIMKSWKGEGMKDVKHFQFSVECADKLNWFVIASFPRLSFPDGKLYAGTVSDFSGSDALILKDQIRTPQYDLKHLNGKSREENVCVCFEIPMHSRPPCFGNGDRPKPWLIVVVTSVVRRSSCPVWDDSNQVTP